jgi:hypothetical protein
LVSEANTLLNRIALIPKPAKLAMSWALSKMYRLMMKEANSPAVIARRAKNATSENFIMHPQQNRKSTKSAANADGLVLPVQVI